MKKTFLFALWSWCLLFLGTRGFSSSSVLKESQVEHEISSEAGAGMEISIPHGYADFLPGLQVRLNLPLEIHPWAPPKLQDLGVGIRLHWGNRFTVYGGNLRFSGPLSLLNTAAPTMTINPLANFSLPTPSLTVGMPNFTETSAPYGAALVASLGRGFARDRINLWFAGTEKKEFFGGLAIPLQWGEVKLHLGSALGFWFSEGNLPSWDDDWFSKNRVYGDIWLGGLVMEGHLSWNWFKFYSGVALVEQPWGGFGYWIRSRFMVEWEDFPLRVLGGIYGGTPNGITAEGSQVRESLQFYINPQFDWNVAQWGRSGKIQTGIAFGTSFDNTQDMSPQLFVDGKLRLGLRFVFTGGSVDLTGDWLGIRLNNFKLKRSLRTEEKYGGRLGFTMNQFVNIKIYGGGHYENRGGSDRDRIVATGGLSCKLGSGIRGTWTCFIPELAASTELVFSQKEGFLSATTEAKASWNIRFPYGRVGVWMALKLKQTTQ